MAITSRKISTELFQKVNSQRCKNLNFFFILNSLTFGTLVIKPHAKYSNRIEKNYKTKQNKIKTKGLVLISLGFSCDPIRAPVRDRFRYPLRSDLDFVDAAHLLRGFLCMSRGGNDVRSPQNVWCFWPTTAHNSVHSCLLEFYFSSFVISCSSLSEVRQC